MRHSQLENEVLTTVRTALEHHLQEFHSYKIKLEEGGFPTISVKCQVDESPLTRTNVLNIAFIHEDQQMQIPTLYLPAVLRGEKLMFGLLKSIREICQNNGYDLFIVDMVPGFHRKMVSLGAEFVDEDTVAILPETRLE